MKHFMLGLATLLLVSSSVQAQEPVNFSGKTITMVVGNTAGGGTDIAGRLVAQFLEKYLPGNPTVVVRNMPGAQGVLALNHVYMQTKRDGLTVMSGSASQVTPIVFKKANGQFDPAKFKHIGGLGRGGSVLLISVDAAKRLTDRTAAPIVFGVVDVTRPTAQVAMWGIEYLDWNVKWVSGYRGSNDTTLALERGEIDMTTTSNLFLIERLVASGRFKILNQSGSIDNGKYYPRPEFGNAPVFRDLVVDKVKDETGKRALAYWESAEAVDKWFALSDGTPDDVVNEYRVAFAKMVKDPDFIERGKKISEDLSPMIWQDMQQLVTELAIVTPQTDEYILAKLRKQGAIQ